LSPTNTKKLPIIGFINRIQFKVQPRKPLTAMADRAPPTPLAMLIGTAIISLMTGYMLGLASSLGLVPIPFMQSLASPRSKAAGYQESEVESSEEEIEVGSVPLDHAPNWANGEAADRRDGLRQAEPLKTSEVKEAAWEMGNEECKLVLVVRTDLGMTKGNYMRTSTLFHSLPNKINDSHNI
jgi:peptidyl-tRNA hydrolase, PTH2 family